MSQPPNTIHYTQLPPSRPDAFCIEYETFRREIGRLLAEGHEGKWVLLKGEQIIGLFETREEARDEGYRRFLLSGFLIQPILTYHPLVRSLVWWFYPCPTPATP
jgi:hypothetical protein